MNRIISDYGSIVLTCNDEFSSSINRTCVPIDGSRIGTDIQQKSRLDQTELIMSDSNAELAAPGTAKLANKLLVCIIDVDDIHVSDVGGVGLTCGVNSEMFSHQRVREICL